MKLSDKILQWRLVFATNQMVRTTRRVYRLMQADAQRKGKIKDARAFGNMAEACGKKKEKIQIEPSTPPTPQPKEALPILIIPPSLAEKLRGER